MSEHGKRPLGLTLIAIGKAIKCVVLIAVGVSMLTMASKGPSRELLHVADVLRIDRGNHVLQSILAKVTGVSAKRLEELSIATFVYTALFAVEGTALWLQKRWGEYLTLIITISFIPLEVYELVEHGGVGKIITLVLNIAVAVYLVVRLVHRRREHHGRGRPSSSRFIPLTVGGIASTRTS